MSGSRPMTLSPEIFFGSSVPIVNSSWCGHAWHASQAARTIASSSNAVSGSRSVSSAVRRSAPMAAVCFMLLPAARSCSPDKGGKGLLSNTRTNAGEGRLKPPAAGPRVPTTPGISGSSYS
eukprot:8958821-Pyramimonas_sp.AAC.1